MNPGTQILAAAAFGPADLLGQQCTWSHARVLEQSRGLAADWDVDTASQRFGVESRQWARGSDITPCDLAEGAALRALADAGLQAGDLDLLVTATSTPSQATSSLAGALASRLGVQCVSQDVRAGGAGGLQALRCAERWISGTGQVALVVASEVISPWLDLQGVDPALLVFGDGAGALVLRSNSEARAGCHVFVGASHAPDSKPFTVPGRLPPQVGFEFQNYLFQQADRSYGRTLAALRIEICGELASAHAEADGGTIDAFFPMAPTLHSSLAQGQALGVEAQRVHTCLQSWGCPGAAAPLISLAESKPRKGWTLALAAVGGGVHCAALTWNFGD